MKHLTEMVRQHQSGQNKWNLCRLFRTSAGAGSRNPLRQCKPTPLLIEATSNQVDQFGGYYRNDARRFSRLCLSARRLVEFPQDALILGGDHLGPKPLAKPAGRLRQWPMPMI